MSEVSNYKKNLEDFVSALEGCYIEKIIYYEDPNPEFDKDALPFQFKYCYKATFVTNIGNFVITASQTSWGYDIFWIGSSESVNHISSEKLINSRIKIVTSRSSRGRLPYKLTIELENDKITIYAADIYTNRNKKYTMKVNDEMILVFDNDLEVKSFETY